LIHHSDQGVQYYASSEYVARLEEAGVLISMAAVGNPYENAKAESFFRELLPDLIDGGGLPEGLPRL
jgi:putative transposase